MIDARLARELAEQGKVVLLLVIDFEVGDAEVVERRKHLVAERVLQRDAIRDDVVEQAIDIVSVGPARRGRHAEDEPRLEVVEHLAIPRCARAVRLVDDDVVESIGREIAKMPRERSHHGEQAGGSLGAIGALVQVVGIGGAEHALEAFARSREDALAMGDEENGCRPLAFDVECREVRLARPRRRNEQRAGFVSGVQHSKGLKRAFLHLVGPDARNARRADDSIARRRPRAAQRCAFTCRRALDSWHHPLASGRCALNILEAEELHLRHAHHAAGFARQEGLVPVDPGARQRLRFRIVPQLVVFLFRLEQHLAVRERTEKNVPFLVAG